MPAAIDRAASSRDAGEGPSRPSHRPARAPSAAGVASVRVLRLAGVPVWLLLLASGLVVGPAYLSLPDAYRDVAYAALACVTPVIIAIAIAHYRPRHQVWALVGLGVALMAAGELAWIAEAVGLGGGSLADPLYLLGYVPLCAAMAGAARRQGARMGPAIDAAIVSVAAAAVMWFLVVGPALADSSLSLGAAAVAIAYPLADLLVLGFLLRILLDRPRATPALALFALGVTTFLVADVAYSALAAQGAYASGPADLGWMAGYLLWAAAACHPSMTVMRARADADTHLSNRRLVVLAVAATVPLLVAAMDQVWDTGVDPLPAVLASVVMFLLVVARLTDLVRDQRALIDERVRMQAELERLSLEDSLTGLANRRGFEARLVGPAGETPAAVLLVDLDDFKRINDTLGHASGDAVLTAVARRLRASVRGRDVVARLGGDEFAVLMSDAAGPEAAIMLGERLLEDVRRPIPVGEVDVRIGASVGIAMANGPVDDPDVLMRNADLALYRAKGATARRIELFDEELQRESVRALAIRDGLAGAVARGELRLAYQPIVDLSAARPVAAEAQLQWEHPGLGAMSAAELMHRAEASGAMPAIGAWSLGQACRDAVEWRSEAGPLRVNLRLAPSQLRDEGLADVVRDALAGSGLAPARLVLAISEPMLDMTAEVRARLAAVCDLGVSLAIDDVGIGATALTRLGGLPVRELALDRALLETDSRLLGAVRQFGAALGVRVVMTDIRDRAELEMVEALRFDGVQGPAVADAMRLPALVSYLARQRQPSTMRPGWRPVADRGML